MVKMKYLKYIPLVILLFSTAHTQYSKIRVGIMPFYDYNKKNTAGSNSKIVLSELSDSFSKYRFINLVERSKMEELVKEIELGQTGLVDENTAARLGKVQGLQVMVVGTINSDRITARAIHMETQKVIKSYSVPDISSIEVLGKKIASGIEVFIARENLKSMRNDSPSIDFKFWIDGTTDNREVKVGSKVEFKFKSNSDGFLTIVDIQPGGDVVILYPNDLHPSNKISAGMEYTIPSKEDGFEITVSEPAGLDTIVAFFTKTKVEWLDRNKLTGEGFWTVKENEKFALSRGFKITATKLRSADWESKTIEVMVVK